MHSGIQSISAATQSITNLTQGAVSTPTLTKAASETAPTPFADLMTDAVTQVNQLEDQAHAAVKGLMTGSGVDVHQAMIATEKSSMAFELALSVRNKAIQAYQTVVGMQF
jgi:flagellar hook-basal body complex protein FliE